MCLGGYNSHKYKFDPKAPNPPSILLQTPSLSIPSSQKACPLDLISESVAVQTHIVLLYVGVCVSLRWTVCAHPPLSLSTHTYTHTL